MKCDLLRQLYVKVVLPNFEEGFLKKGILWSLKRVVSREDGRTELLKVYNESLKVIEEHLGSRGQLEKLVISGGEVVDKGVKLGRIVFGRFIRGLCYTHRSQYFIRIYLKEVSQRLILTMYGDVCEDSPWLTEIVDPSKLRLSL